VLLALGAATLAAPAAVDAQPTGTVTGTVTNASTGAPVEGVGVGVATANGVVTAIDFTDASGMYNITVQPGALYYVVTSSAQGYLAEAFPDVECVFGFCTSTDLREAAPFSVPAGGVVSGRNFAIVVGGSISGTVTNAVGAAVNDVSVTAWVRLGNTTFGTSATTNAAGSYTIRALQPGTYFLSTSAGQGLRNEIYDNIPCTGPCTAANALDTGSPVPVSVGTPTTGRNFSLETGGSISGVITNAAAGVPMAGVTVTAAAKVGTTAVNAGNAVTNASGEYTISGLAAATYAVYTSSSSTTNEIYPDLLCLNFCSATTAVDGGGGVNVALGATAAGINLALDPGLSVSGTVTNEATGLPIQSVNVTAWLRVGQSFSGRSAFTNASGAYTIPGLVAGTYVLSTSSGQYMHEIFDNVACVGACSATQQLVNGTPVGVTPGANTTGKNFALQPLATGSGQITGTITDPANGLPIAAIGVEIWMQSGPGFTFVTSTSTNLAGAYTVSGLLPGSYRVDTSGLHPYRNEAFDNVACLSLCASSIIFGSTPVAVTTGGVVTASFGLSAGDGFAGTVTDAATGAPLQGVLVNAYQVGSNQFAGQFTTNLRGQYFIRGLPNGEYVALTSNSLGYFDEIHDNIRCSASCSSATALSTGTRITVTGAAAFAGTDVAELVTGINFGLDVRTQAPNAPSNLRVVTAGGTGVFTWTAGSLLNAGAATSYLLEAGFAPGTTAITLPIPGTAATFSVPGVPPGTYYVRVRAVNAHGTSGASNEVRLVVGAGGTGLPEPPIGLSAFMAGDRITITWNPAAGGGPPSGYVVEAGSSSGASNIATLNVPLASFTFSPVPNGFYFIRVRARNAAGVSLPSTEIMVVVGNVPAPPSSPSLSHSVSGSTVTLSWTAPAFGPVTGYVIEAGSATGLSNIAVAAVGNVLTQAFTGVPPGTYYVRIRAVNTQGRSIVSNERTIVVS
jgi:5-hydroxyisourate hydrolase-like protein (transthyretin family)